jgi:tape measure domain-containing protein
MESNVGDITAKLKVDISDWQRSLNEAARQVQDFGQKTRQTQQQLSQLPFNAVQNAIDQFSRATLNAGNSQSRLQDAIRQAQQQLQQFGVSLNAQGQAVDRFGQQLSRGMTESIAQFRTGIREAQAELGQLQRFGIDAGGGSGGGILQTALGIAGGLGIATSMAEVARGIANATGAMLDFGKAVIETGVKLESLRLSFAGAFGGQAQGREAFRQTVELSQRLGTNLETLAESYRRFENAIRGTVLEGDRGRQIFENLSVAARGLGLNTHETGQFMNAATQMIQRGAVSMEELRRQMGNVAPAIQVAARALGVTTAELERMVSTGKTQSIPFVEALARQFAQEFGPAAEGAGRSAAAAFERLRTEFTLLKEAIAQSGLLSFLANVTQGVKDLLENLRGLREERQREAGGPGVVIPPELAQSPTIQRNQAEIDRLRASLTPQIEFGEIPDLSQGLARLGMTADEARAKIRALEEEQRKAIDASKRMMDAELATQQRMVTTDPRRTAAENLMKILREGEERLRDIDVRAKIEPDLDVLNEKLKATEKTLQDVRKAFDALGAGVQAPMMQGFKPSQYDPILNRISSELNIDPNIARALMEQESGGRNVVSRAGAIGPMQVMPGTGAQLGYSREQLFDPESNIRAGLTYLAQMIERFGGDVSKALTAYNAGPGHGGIPLPTGENATFARDVLARVPTDALGIVATAQRQRDAAKEAIEAQKRDAREAADTIADIRKRVLDDQREQDQEQRQYIQERATNLDIFGLLLSPEQEAELKRQMAEQHQRIQQAAREMDIFGLEVPPEVAAQRRAEGAFDLRLRQQLEQAQLSRIQRPEGRLRAEMEREGVPITPERESQLRRLTEMREEQERLNEVIGIWRDLSSGVGSAWVNALSSIAEGTQSVSEAFAAMGKSIMKTMADIAAQQAFQAIFRLGVGLITGALMPTPAAAGGGGAMGGAGGGGFLASLVGGTSTVGSGAGAGPSSGAFAFQHGGVINSPTRAILGESPAHNPEVILNRFQMQAMAAGGGAGQAVNIHNYPSKAEAEAGAARDRASGHRAIVNEVLTDLSAGSGSKIGRAMRLLQT